MNTRIRAPLAAASALAGVLIMLPAGAVSLDATGPAQPLPEGAPSAAAPMAIESWSAGSAALVPLMAADAPSRETPAVDAPAKSTSRRWANPWTTSPSCARPPRADARKWPRRATRCRSSRTPI